MSEAHPTATYIPSKSLELRGVLVPPSLPLPLRELCRPPSKFESKDSDRMNAGTMTAQQLFGPMLVGVLFNGILYGALVVQLFTYYDRYYKSDPFVRYLVVYLLIAETANTVFDINLIYQPLVIGWGNLEQLQKSPLFLRPDAAVTVAISTPVQLFMAWRLQRLTKHSLMPGIILLLALVSLAGGLSVTIKVSLQQDYSAFPGFKPFTTVWLAATAACDLFLSTALIYSLKVRKTGVGPTDRYIDRVIRLTIQTGSITAVAALLDLFVFLFAPSATLQFIWDFPLSKLYSNALLSSLNSRPWKEELAPPLTLNVLYEPTPPPNARTSGLEFADVLVPGMGGETELHQRARHVAFQASASGGVGTTETNISVDGPSKPPESV